MDVKKVRLFSDLDFSGIREDAVVPPHVFVVAHKERML